MISTKTRYIRIWNKWQKIWDWMVRKKYFHQFLAIEPLIFIQNFISDFDYPHKHYTFKHFEI